MLRELFNLAILLDLFRQVIRTTVRTTIHSKRGRCVLFAELSCSLRAGFAFIPVANLARRVANGTFSHYPPVNRSYGDSTSLLRRAATLLRRCCSAGDCYPRFVASLILIPCSARIAARKSSEIPLYEESARPRNYNDSKRTHLNDFDAHQAGDAHQDVNRGLKEPGPRGA